MAMSMTKQRKVKSIGKTTEVARKAYKSLLIYQSAINNIQIQKITNRRTLLPPLEVHSVIDW